MKPGLTKSRRRFLQQSAAIIAASTLVSQSSAAMQTDQRPLVVSTWPFGKPANEKALKTILAGGSALDGVEQGIRLTEVSGNLSVGLSGKPNAANFAQLDACMMNGPGHQAGSVAAIEGIRHPISAARRVMERTPHVMLAGLSARHFALSEGLESIEISNHASQSDQWWAQQNREVKPQDVNANNHDTIALLVLSGDGTLAGGCSTSGLAGKMPGRVGDSPIIGSGLYVDNQVGAAGSTGVGENVMRYCATFLIVEFMRQGASPTEACEQAIERIRSIDAMKTDLGINFIAIDKQGRYGAAGTADFPYSVTYPGYSEVETAKKMP